MSKRLFFAAAVLSFVFVCAPSARNLNLNALRFAASEVSFEIPFGAEKVALHGRLKDDVIAGDYEHRRASEKFPVGLLENAAGLAAQTIEPVQNSLMTENKKNPTI